MRNCFLNGMRREWLYFIGIVLFGFILSRIDFLRLVTILLEADIRIVFLGLLLHIVIVVIRAYKWQYIMKKQELSYALWDCCVMYASGMYLGLITPGRIGEFGRVWYLKEGHSFGTSMWSVFLDRITDFMMLALIASLGVWYFIGEVFMFLIVLGFVFIQMRSWEGFTRSFLGFMLPKRYKKMVIENLSDFFAGLNGLSVLDGSWIVSLTVVVWVMYLFQVYLMSLSLQLPLSFAFVGFSVGISGLVSLLPITVFGVGTRDATFIFLFGLRGLGKESAVALSTLTLAIFIFSAAIGLMAWVWKPISIRFKS